MMIFMVGDSDQWVAVSVTTNEHELSLKHTAALLLTAVKSAIDTRDAMMESGAIVFGN